MRKQDRDEFNEILMPYQSHDKVQELKKYLHHGITRYDHSFRVAYYTYFITKKLRLDYASATKAAMLHDFYFDEVERERSSKRLVLHPYIASSNAEKFFGLSLLEKDIIEKHMFPITKKKPKYLESWIVDFVDDVSAIYERVHSTRVKVSSIVVASIFVLFLMIR